MTNIIRASLDLFIAVSVLAAFGQDVYKLTFSQGTPTAVSNQSPPSSSSV